MKAILFILAVVLPLMCVLLFLKALIGSLGNPTMITKLPEEKEEEKENEKE